MEVDFDERSIIYREKIVDAEEFIYIRRSILDKAGVFIYTKDLSQECRQFSCVDRVKGWLSQSPKHKVLVDKSILCEAFDGLMAFAIEKDIFLIPSEPFPGSTSHFSYIVGVKTKNGDEHWYSATGRWQPVPGYRQLMETILAGDEGKLFRELLTNPWFDADLWSTL